jgi:protein-S-isoprenylcysteine O-methyltransferase Ste14
MTLPSLPPLLRRVALSVWFVTFYWLLFFFLPSRFIEWNVEFGWPVWRSGPTRALGALMLVGGVGVIAHCTGLFAFIGRGTPVPVAPPEKLVIRGLYRYSRNPIYVANVVVWLGIFLWNGHVTLLLLTVMAITVTELVIVLSEEPGLRRRFGSDYEDYCAQVPRWLRPRPARR